MTAVFDAETGRLRLDQQTFDCLVAWARGSQDPGPELVDLRDAGAIERGALHPKVRPGVQAVTAPACQLRVALVDDDGQRRSGDGWVSSDAAALLLDVPEGMRDLVTVHPTLLPMAIARVVRLGPHPRPGAEPLHLSRTDYDELLGFDPTARAGAAERLGGDAPDPPLRGVVECLGAGPWRVWAVSLSWTMPGGDPGVHALQVVDTRAGLCLVDIGESHVTLWPTSATGIWRRLTLLLPDDVEEPR